MQLLPPADATGPQPQRVVEEVAIEHVMDERRHLTSLSEGPQVTTTLDQLRLEEIEGDSSGGAPSTTSMQPVDRERALALAALPRDQFRRVRG